MENLADGGFPVSHGLQGTIVGSMATTTPSSAKMQVIIITCQKKLHRTHSIVTNGQVVAFVVFANVKTNLLDKFGFI